MSITAFLYSILGLGGLAALIYVVRSIKQWGAADIKTEQAEKERDDANENAKDLANRPRTIDDTRNRLRAWRDKL